ncbi:hypothetical protein [Flavobacterium sp.]|nr:hypothetical protein [Flavobacterium sp.]
MRSAISPEGLAKGTGASYAHAADALALSWLPFYPFRMKTN